MKQTLLITFLVSLCMTEMTEAGGPGTKWDAQLQAKMESTGSVLLYRDNPPGPPSYYISATLSQVATSPDWSTNCPLPPLSLEAALTMAKKELEQKNRQFDSFRLTQAGLGRISGRGTGETKWWYLLNYYGTSRTHRDRKFLVPVLMDGTFLKPSLIEEDTGWIMTDKMTSSQSIAEIHAKGARNAPETEKRLSAIIIPEIDFRQANIFDIIAFYDKAIPQHGTGAETNDATRIRIRVHKAALGGEALPYALPELPPCLTFTAKKISLLNALRLTAGLAQLELFMDGNVITLYNSKE